MVMVPPNFKDGCIRYSKKKNPNFSKNKVPPVNSEVLIWLNNIENPDKIIH